jgi:hypothetical protein
MREFLTVLMFCVCTAAGAVARDDGRYANEPLHPMKARQKAARMAQKQQPAASGRLRAKYVTFCRCI